MSAVVWRAPVSVGGLPEFTVEMPAGSELLGLSANSSGPQLYFRVFDKDAPNVAWRFEITGTGWHSLGLRESGAFVGTFPAEGLLGETLVFHVFADIPHDWRGWRRLKEGR